MKVIDLTKRDGQPKKNNLKEKDYSLHTTKKEMEIHNNINHHKTTDLLQIMFETREALLKDLNMVAHKWVEVKQLKN